MNKVQLVEAVAAAGKLTKKEAEVAVKAVTDSIVEALKNGDKVQLVGFGTFEVKTREERKGRNPKTGEVVTVPACKYLASKHPTFSAGKAFKDAVN